MFGAPKALLVGAAAAVLLLVAVAGPLHGASRPTLRGTGGAVSSDEKQATEAGLEVLRRGGNAVDGAVATALALAVVQPEAGNLGGGGFVTLKMDGEVSHLDFREQAPAAAFREMYLDEEGNPVPDASIIGPLAAGVPGSPSGLHALHQRFGRLPWADVVAPAIRLAKDGFVASSRLSEALDGEKEMLLRFPETSAVWLPDGKVPQPGALIKLPELALTLERYAAEGPKAVTRGEIAEAVERSSKKHGGILTAADLAAYEPVWRAPVLFEAFGWTFASADLPSSGGILIASSLKQLEAVDWQSRERFGADRAHLIAEVWRRAYADRFLLGDPTTTSANASDLLSERWLTERGSTLKLDRATPSEEVQLWSDTVEVEEPKDTTHLSVVDADGNLVALTTTLNGLFGCGLYVPEAGFFLNNEMDDFAAAPGRPNLYGLIQGEANAVRPGKRMLSSQSPTLAWRGGKRGGEKGTVEAIAIGGRGGSRIPTATMQVLLGVVVDNDGLQGALDRPRIHHQWRPDKLFHEPDALSPETRATLAAKGHTLEAIKSIAQVQAVRWSFEGDRAWVEAGADPRGGAGTAGVVEPLP